jgi:hypothetical protein
VGSAITTVGNKGGKPLFLFTAANQDSLCIFSTAPNAVYPPVTGNSVAVGDLPMGYKSLIFQLTGTNTAGSVLVYGTIDLATARGLGTEWTPVPSPSTEAAYGWSNPLTKAAPGQAALKVDAPFIAYRAVASGDFVGSATLLVLAAP